MLQFKLFDKSSESILPIAGILAPMKTSRLVQTNYHISAIYSEEIHKLTISGGIFETPYAADKDYNLNMTDISDGLMVSDSSDYNCTYTLQQTTALSPNVRIINALNNQPLFRFKVQYYNGSSWQDDPSGTGAQTVRLLMLDEDVAGQPLLILYDRDTQENYHELLNTDNVSPLYAATTDWTASIQNNKIVITPSGALSSATELYVKQNALNRIDVLMPFYQWYHNWYFLVRKGVLLTETNIFITKNLPYPQPAALQKDSPVTLITRTMIQVPVPDIDTSKPVVIYFNGQKQEDIIADYAPRFGIIRLKRSIPVDAVCTVDYEIVNSQWLELSSVDFNPHRNHDSGKPFTYIGDTSVHFWIQPVNLGGQVMHSYSAEPGIAYFETNQSGTMVRSNWQLLVTARTLHQAPPALVDLRKSGGGLKPVHRDSLDTTGYTDWGFYDGKPVDNISLVLRIPRSVYDDFYQRYYQQGYPEIEARQLAEQYIRNAVEKFAPAGVNLIYQDKNGNPLFA